MSWNCEQTEALLTDYLDGLMIPGERQNFEAHLNACKDCAQVVASVSQLVGNLHSMEQVEPAPQLIYAILNKTLGPRETKKGWRFAFGWISGLASPRFAYSAVSIGASLTILLAASGVSLRKPKLADLSPVNIARSVDRQAHLVYARSTKFVSDLRVVYEIQSRLNNKDNELPTAPENTLPSTAPDKAPGSTDGTRPNSQRQQNRAYEIRREMEVIAMEAPVLGAAACSHLLEGSIR